MSEIYEHAVEKRANVFMAVSIASAVLFLLAYFLSFRLCHSLLPITWFLVGLPTLGAMSAIVSLFNPKSSLVTILCKLLLLVANLLFLGLAGIVLTGLGIAKCG
jgi:hypothetical protein